MIQFRCNGLVMVTCHSKELLRNIGFVSAFELHLHHALDVMDSSWSLAIRMNSNEKLHFVPAFELYLHHIGFVPPFELYLDPMDSSSSLAIRLNSYERK